MMTNRMSRKPENTLSERTKRRHALKEQRRIKNMILKSIKPAVTAITESEKKVDTFNYVVDDCESK